jgi:hypothetical protein
VEAASTGKLAAVAASATAIAGGGLAVVDRRLDDSGGARSQPLVRARAATASAGKPAQVPARAEDAVADRTSHTPPDNEPSPQVAGPTAAPQPKKARAQEFGFDGGEPVAASADASPDPVGSPAAEASSASDTAASSRDAGGGEFVP